MGARENYVEALKVERAYCEQFGKARRLAEVEAELAQYGDTPQAPPVETADVEAPAKPRGRGRKADAEDAG